MNRGASSSRTTTRRGKRGAQRKGVRAGDLLMELTDRDRRPYVRPQHDKPRVLIETMRFVGEDRLTARDQAVYEFLVANARHAGIDRDAHAVRLGDLMAYVSETTPERIADSLERLTRTLVRYDLRHETTRVYGAMPFIIAQVTEDLLEGMATLEYTIPAPVRHAILAATHYTMLEINAFAGFSSRYSGRLYQRLALRTGRTWEVEPLELAKALNYRPAEEGLLWAYFWRRCLEPALADIAEHVQAFSVSFDPGKDLVRGRGRGRPVEKIRFRVSAVHQRWIDLKAAPLHRNAWHQAKLPDALHSDEELPSTLAIGKAKTATGWSEFDLLHGWRAMLDRVKKDPRGKAATGLEAWLLLRVLKDDGADAAFAFWAQAMWQSGERPTERREGLPQDGLVGASLEASRYSSFRNRPAAVRSATAAAQEPARDSPPPPPVRRSPPPMPAFLRKSAQAPATPTPQARPALQDSRVYRAQRAPDLPADMPRMEGGNVVAYEAAMREWLAARQAAPATAPDSPVPLSEIPVGTVVDDIPF